MHYYLENDTKKKPMKSCKIIILGLSVIGLVSCDRGAVPQENNTDFPVQETKLENPLTVERLYDSPLLAGDRVRGLEISPDGSRITFLKGKEDNFRVLDLWQFDTKTGEETLLVDSKEIVGTGEETLSDEEKARRERRRIYEQGIVEYQWSKQGDKILFPINGDIYLYDLTADRSVIRVTDSEAFELDPRFSPKGNYISFVRDHNVTIVRLADMKEIQVTTFGSEDKPMGVAEFIAQEEMRRYRGYWWSPNEAYLAVAQVDNTPVGTIERFEVYPEKISLVEQRYPRAGTDNAIVRLGIVPINAGDDQQANQAALTWVPIDASDYYIPQVKWLPVEEKSILSYSIETRDQKTLDLWSYDVEQGQPVKLLQETDPAWINIRHDYVFLGSTQQLLWISEKSGFSHIHLYDWAGNELRSLTSGEWEVLDIQAVDEARGKVYFTATRESALEQHLYAIDLAEGGTIEKVSMEAGIHNVTMAEKPEFYIDNFTSPEQPFRIAVHGLDGKHRFYINENKIDATHPLNDYVSDLSVWEYHEYQSKSGTPLYYKILKPKNIVAEQKYPLVQFVYGGPGPQMVRKGWGDLFHQLLAQQGFIVLVADNRGTAHRGREFEREFYLKFGAVEVADQAEVLEHVSEKFPFIDTTRVGVYGHSYGGYLSLMLILQKPELYQVAVAGAPVVDWKLYDTHYTERYIGKPSDNEALYQQANVTSYAGNLTGRLLVVHGMADDNVLYNNSLLLYQALQEKGKRFDIMLYPGAKHGIRGKKEWQIHYRNETYHYFRDHLLN